MSTEIAKVNESTINSILSKITQMEQSGGLTLPKDYSAENALKSAWLILQETKDKNSKSVLEVCSKASIANSLLDMAVQGLNPVKKQCYFIAYGTSLQMMRSYMGTVAVAKRYGDITELQGCWVTRILLHTFWRVRRVLVWRRRAGNIDTPHGAKVGIRLAEAERTRHRPRIKSCMG